MFLQKNRVAEKRSAGHIRMPGCLQAGPVFMQKPPLSIICKNRRGGCGQKEKGQDACGVLPLEFPVIHPKRHTGKQAQAAAAYCTCTSSWHHDGTSTASPSLTLKASGFHGLEYSNPRRVCQPPFCKKHAICLKISVFGKILPRKIHAAPLIFDAVFKLNGYSCTTHRILL